MRTWWMEIKSGKLSLQVTGVGGKDVEEAIKNLRRLLNDMCFDVVSVHEHYEQ